MVSSQFLSCLQDGFHNFHIIRRLVWSEEYGSVFNLDLILTGPRRVSSLVMGYTWHCCIKWVLFRWKANSSTSKRGFGGVTFSGANILTAITFNCNICNNPGKFTLILRSAIAINWIFRIAIAINCKSVFPIPINSSSWEKNRMSVSQS